MGAWTYIKAVRELNLFNKKFQSMRESIMNYCPEVVNNLLSCKILKGRLVSVTQ